MKATKWCGRSWLAHVRIVKSDWLNVWKSGGARRFELSCAVDFKREGCATHVNANGLWFQIACTCKEGLRGRIKGPREYSSVVSVMGKRRSKNPQHPERVTILCKRVSLLACICNTINRSLTLLQTPWHLGTLMYSDNKRADVICIGALLCHVCVMMMVHWHVYAVAIYSCYSSIYESYSKAKGERFVSYNCDRIKILCSSVT